MRASDVSVDARLNRQRCGGTRKCKLRKQHVGAWLERVVSVDTSLSLKMLRHAQAEAAGADGGQTCGSTHTMRLREQRVRAGRASVVSVDMRLKK